MRRGGGGGRLRPAAGGVGAGGLAAASIRLRAGGCGLAGFGWRLGRGIAVGEAGHRARGGWGLQPERGCAGAFAAGWFHYVAASGATRAGLAAVGC